MTSSDLPAQAAGGWPRPDPVETVRQTATGDSGSPACYHCAEPVPPASGWSINFDGIARPLCCPGCSAVMQTIIDAGLADYYRFRSEPAPLGVLPTELSDTLASLQVFDEPEISERYLHKLDEQGRVIAAGAGSDTEVNLAVDGLRCGACVWLLERSVSTLPGVHATAFNFATGRGQVRFDASRMPLSGILHQILQLGYRAAPFDAREREQRLQLESRQLLQQLFIAGIGMMQVMMYALPAYLTVDGGMDPAHEGLLRWASLVLTTPVLLYSAQPFLRGAWRDLQARRPGMDTPVSLALLIAFTASVWSTFTGTGHIYFDSVAMFVFLLLGARYLEFRARCRAMRAVDELGAAAPETALRFENGTWHRVPASRLQPGDRIRVDQGARVPVDATVTEGISEVDLSLLTGESMPQPVRPGEAVPGGALLSGAPLQLSVERAQSLSALSMIERLVDRGAMEKPPIVRSADRVAAWFVTGLLGLSLLVGLYWWWADSSRAATIAITVLVVSCPCALSLATPTAMAAATARLLRERLLVTRGHALEALAGVTHVVFDKTGTLTNGRPKLVAVTDLDSIDRDAVLAMAAALETGSAHPFAVALRAMTCDDARVEQICATLQKVEHVAGQGIAAVLSNGERWRLGSAQWCGLANSIAEPPDMTPVAQRPSTSARDQAPAPLSSAEANANPDVPLAGDQPQACSEVILASASQGSSFRTRARLQFSDSLRPDARQVVDKLQAAGLEVELLSGDRVSSVAQVAGQLGLSTWQGAATPADKQARVASLQAQGARVLMVGDGINDAPVLALADVSLVVGDASALTRSAADFIALLPGLASVVLLLRKARQTRHVVRQNLLWAALYNLSAIPLAAAGLVAPWAAALGMATSSLLVVLNASRLWSERSVDPD